MRIPLTHLNSAVVLRRLGALAGAIAMFATCSLATAQAGTIDLSARAKRTTVAVIGDSVANDLGRGLEDLFENNPRVRIVKETQFSTGLVRTDYFDWDTTVRKFLAQHDPDVIVVVIGGNDRQAIRTKNARYDILTKPWLREYDRRVARFMKQIKRERTQVYWVNLPPVRSDNLTQAYRVMNKIYARQAARHGFHYLSLWDKFLVHGAYSSFGQSLEGVKRKLRKDDGMHFTEAGRILFASYVANAIGLR